MSKVARVCEDVRLYFMLFLMGHLDTFLFYFLIAHQIKTAYCLKHNLQTLFGTFTS